MLQDRPHPYRFATSNSPRQGNLLQPLPITFVWLLVGQNRQGEMPSLTPRKGRVPIPLTLPSQVNIDHFTKAVTMKNLVEPSPSSFDMAQKRIFALMEKDSLPRFVRSEFYQELIK